jgi:poly(3-hydroxybutyrate) depolymerase
MARTKSRVIRRCLIASAFIPSLMASATAQTTVTLSLQIDGTKRSAVLRVPNGAEKPPVVFYVHGATDNPEWFRNNGNTDATADREKYIAIYTCAHSDCQGGVWQDTQGPGNFPYFFALLDSVDARYKVDRSRVYMTGFSQGGNITSYAACNYSDIFAAVAPVSGHIDENVACNPKRPIPVYLTYGTRESFVGNFLKGRDRWLKLNNCPANGTVTKPYPASSRNSKRVRVAHGPCEENTAVVMDSIIDHTHRWPSQSNGNQADEIWAFLKQYSLKTTTEARPRASARPGLPITASYASGMIRLGGLREEAQVEVADTRGELIAKAKTLRHQFAFKGGAGGVYLVTVRGGGRVAARKIIIP